MKIDKFTKAMITLNAVSTIGINYNLYKNSIKKNTNEENNLNWQVTSDDKNIYIIANDGKDICNAYTNTSSMITGKWVKTHC